MNLTKNQNMWETVTRKDLSGEHPVLGERAVEADD